MASIHVRSLARVALCVLVVGGCASPPPSPPDRRTHEYVISAFRLAGPVGYDALGFDLDELNSTGEGPTCVDLTPDFSSLNDPGEAGIDNELARLVPTLRMLIGDLDAALAAPIVDGSQLIVIEVGGIDSYTTDDSVTVRLMRGTVRDGGPPLLDARGALLPGQDFGVRPLQPAVEGQIHQGRLRAHLPSFEILVDGGGDIGRIPLSLEDVQLRANVTQTMLANGAIGGAIALPADELTRSAVQGDLDPDPEDPTICRALSAGIGFTAVDHVDDFDDAI